MILVFDTETTGLPKHADASLELQPRVIEFGGCRLNSDDGFVIDEFELLMDPGTKLDPIITKITGLTDDDLKGALTFAQAWPQIEQYIQSCTVYVAHNLPFDESLINFELKRLGIEFKWPPTGICTVGMFQGEWGYNPKLTKLYEDIIGKPLAQEHRGLSDVRALVEIIQHEELWRLF